MSLQFNNVLNSFVISCASIWREWLAGAPVTRKQQRETRFRSAITAMTSFMVHPTVEFANSSGWGSFNWKRWTLKINQKYTGKDDIRYKDFVEICSTVYHETRHAEQFYRIAQGLSAGVLKFPDVSVAQNVQAMGAGGGTVRSRIALFESAATGRDPLQQDMAGRVATIAQRLSIPANVAQHADVHRDYFANYLNASRPAWFKRPTVLNEVNEWMRATYKKTFSEMDTWAQGDDGPYRIYRDLPEENDAHGIENRVQSDLYQRIGNDTPTNRRKPRTDPVFGP